MKKSVETWLTAHGQKTMRQVGIEEGFIVLDFGCGSGNYTIPTAEIVGERGRVYALDRAMRGLWPSEGLHKLIDQIRSRRLTNVVVMKTRGALHIDLEDKSVDVVLLYDVLHNYYFPRQEERRTLLQDVHRILKPRGFLSVYPGDPEISHNHTQLATIKREIEDAKFRLETTTLVTIIHEDVIGTGYVFTFRKQ